MMDTSPAIFGYHYNHAGLNCSHGYLLPTVFRLLDGLNLPADQRRLFEVGCGNGSVAHELTRRGWDVTGVDLSSKGIAQANRAHPDLKLYSGSAYDDLAARTAGSRSSSVWKWSSMSTFPASTPRPYFHCYRGGAAILSTPYHGYWKNLALALSGKLDQHFTALWDHGHIKFWSMKTLTILLEEAGFRDIRFERVGRIPPLAKAMIAMARRPG